MNFKKKHRHMSLCIGALFVSWTIHPLLAGESASIEMVPKERPDKWEFTLSMSGGYDSNPTGLGDNLALPPELAQKDSAVIEAEASGQFTYDFAKKAESSGTDLLTLSYDFVADIYADISGNDSNIHTLAASYDRSLCSAVMLELGLTDRLVQSDGDNQFNLFQVRPALIFTESKTPGLWKTLEVAYAFSTFKFFPTGASVHDQDRHSLTADQTFLLSKGYGALVHLSYVHAWNNAQGADYDFEENGVGMRFQTNFGREPLDGQPKGFLHKLSLVAKFKYNFDRYSNPNSKTVFLRRRSDDFGQVILVLAYAVNKHLTLTTSYTYTDAASNIPVYRYHDHTFLSGVSVNF